MAGLLPPPGGSTVRPAAALHAAFLGLTAVLVSAVATGSPVAANDPWLDSSTAQRFLQDGVSSHTVAPGDPSASTAATQSVPPPGARQSSPTINLDTRTLDAVLSQWGLSPSQNSKSFTPSDLFVEGSKPLSSTPPLSPSSEPALLGPGQQTQGPAARLPRDLEVRGTSSALLSPSSHSPLNVSEQQQQQQPRSNASTAAQLNPSTLTRPTTPQFVILTSDRRDPPSEPPVAPNNNQMEAEQSLETVTSLPDRPFEPPKASVDTPEFHPDASHSVDYFSFERPPAVGASSKALDVSELSPSRAPIMQQDDPRGHPGVIHSLLLNSPFVSPQPTSASSEPTQALPEDYFPTNTMDVDWGSGDYMETMSFLGPEGDDYSLVTNLPTDMYDLDQDSNAETYDTAFPSRVGLSLSSMHLHHVSRVSSSSFPPTTVQPFSLFSSSVLPVALEPTATVHGESPDVDWSDALVTVEPTDVLLPDMNSVEYYTTQLTKENTGSAPGAEQRGNVTVTGHFSPGAFISTTHIMATGVFTVHPSHMLTVAFGTEDRRPSDNATWIEDGASTDLSGFEPVNETTPVVNATAVTPQLVNVSEPVVESSVAPTLYMDLSSYLDGTASPAERSTPTPTAELGATSVNWNWASIPPSVTTPVQPDDVTSSSLPADISWFTTESVLISSAHVTPVWTTTATFSPAPTQPAFNVTTGTASNATAVSDEPTTNATSVPPIMVGDQGATDRPPTTIVRTSSPVANATSAITTATTNRTKTTTATTTSLNTATRSPTNVPTSRQYLCNVDKPTYLVKVGFPSGATVGYAKSQIKDILKVEFNRSVELQVVDPPPRFVFRAVSGPVVYTAISVINALRRSGRRFLSISPSWTVPDHKYQVHTVLQFVPVHIDVRVCNFSERIERGLTMAFAEVRRRAQESTNFTVHTVNITMAVPKRLQQRLLPREPVDVIFAVRAARGYLMGSEVSGLLMKLTMVEFSYYMGFPVLQIAEPFHYPELNTTQLLRSSWVRTVLLGVLDQGAGEQTFQAKMERRLALLLGEAMGSVRRVRRATSVGNNSVQIVSTSRLTGDDNPLEVVYFVEGPSGSRLPAVETANTLNTLDVQRAAIVLGYRVQGILAQSVEKVASPHNDGENTNVWIVIGVIIPLLVVVVIISILYWKLCRTDKLEFQPDAMTSMQQQQRQGKLQAPSVKGFDFAKLHLGQHSKEDLMVIQDPSAPPPGGGALSPGGKDHCPYLPDNSEVLTPKSKSSMSSTKLSRSGRRRGRISPSDGDSVASDRSSDREAAEENPRGAATPSGRKMPINVLTGPPPMPGDQLSSSASIFEHVDRMSRSTDAARRPPNKIQLIAMQPMPLPPLHSPSVNGRVPDNNHINKEINLALRHKSEIEHHRNKIRLRAKRKGHYDFPAMDDLPNGFGDAKDPDRVYQKARMQIDKILDPDLHIMPSIFSMEPKKSGRGKRSPKQRKKDQMNGSLDKDHLISNEGDATYRRCPGVSNVAYVSDPDQGSPLRSPSPTDDVFLGPSCSPPGHAPPPPPYMPPQPSIEEARQQMHSLLDNAFALVSPTSQGGTAGITLPGVGGGIGATPNVSGSSPPARGPRQWSSSYPVSPFSGRYGDMGLSPPSVQGLLQRQGLGASSFPPLGESSGPGDQLQADSLYTSRGLYSEELPSSARPRPVGGTTGAQLHHLTQVGLPGRLNGYPPGVSRATLGQNGGLGWNHYHDDYSRPGTDRDAMPRSGGLREPSAPPAHLEPPGLGYPSPPDPMDTSPPTHSSASLIKAIREELMRLSQKQAAVPGYHS